MRKESKPIAKQDNFDDQLTKALEAADTSEVEISRDGSGMTHRDVFSISLRSGTESVDGLIKKALKALHSIENKTNDSTRQEWIQ